jgi:hypothetical protein
VVAIQHFNGADANPVAKAGTGYTFPNNPLKLIDFYSLIEKENQKYPITERIANVPVTKY